MSAAPVAVNLPEGGDEIVAPSPSRIGPLARRGAAWSAGLIACRYIVNIAATALLARMLSPSDYGLIGMVASLTALFQLFSDLGLSWATVQCKDFRRQQADNLFWINTAVGLVLWGACSLVGPLLNGFYGRTELSPVAAALGASFLFSGAAVQPMAILRRQMRFRQLCIAELSSHVAGAVLGVALALMHFGYWALVAQAVGSQCVLAILLMVSGRFWPRFPRRDTRTLPLLKFGGYLAAYGVVSYLARNVDSVLIGRYWGAEQLGYYNRAYFLMTLPTLIATSSLNAVMVPLLSVLRDDAERMGRAYRKAVRMIALVGFPAAIGMAVTAKEIIHIIYGPTWAPVATIFAWLSAAAVFQPVLATAGWLYVVIGKTRQMFFVGVITSAITCSVFLITVRWGAVAMACAYACASVLQTLPLLAVAHNVATLRVSRTFRELAPLLISAVAMGGACLIVRQAMSSITPSIYMNLLVTITGGVATYAGLILRFQPAVFQAAIRDWRGMNPVRIENA